MNINVGPPSPPQKKNKKIKDTLNRKVTNLYSLSKDNNRDFSEVRKRCSHLHFLAAKSIISQSSCDSCRASSALMLTCYTNATVKTQQCQMYRTGDVLHRALEVGYIKNKHNTETIQWQGGNYAMGCLIPVMF